MSKSPTGSDPEEKINRGESVRQNASLHMSKESGEPNIDGESFVTVGKKAQLKIIEPND